MNYLKYSILLLMIAVSMFLIASILRKLDQKKYAEEVVANAKFAFYEMSGKRVDRSTMQNSYLLIFISLDCNYCDNLISDVTSPTMRIYDAILVSTESQDKIVEFNSVRKLDNYPNIHLVDDPQNLSQDVFQIRVYPSIFIYNSSHQMVKKFEGETKIETLLKYLSH